MKEFEDVKKLSDVWIEQKLKVISRGKEGDLCFSFDPMNHLIISEQAYDKLKDCLNFEDVELLQVKYGKKTYYIMHGIKAYDLKCELVERGRFFYDVFDEKELLDKKMDWKYMFRVQFEHGVISEMYYTEKFVELIKELDLQGVEFEVEWDSEADGKVTAEQKEVASIPNGNQSLGAENKEATVEVIPEVIEKEAVKQTGFVAAGMSSEELEKMILTAIVDSTDGYCKSMLTSADDKVHEILVNYFDDGEFIDLGVRVTVCDKDMDNFRDDYYSFTVHNEKLKPMILEYLKSFGSSKRYPQLKKLAKETKRVIKEKGRYVSKKTNFLVEAYD